MAEAPTDCRKMSLARKWANIGLAVGLVAGFLLGAAGVTASVRWEDDAQEPKYRLSVLGVVVFRYPEDGELYGMRPGAEVANAERDIAWVSGLAGGISGWAAGYALGRRTNRCRCNVGCQVPS